MDTLLLIVVLVITSILGYKTISNIPSLLHTPLMSYMNALSGIILLGALTITAQRTGLQVLGYLAIIFATIDAFGGFYITHRMLAMFNNKKKR